MRTDLVGGEDILAKVESLLEQEQDARRAREDAQQALTSAKQADLAAGAEALRTGSKTPASTEPEAQRVLTDAERHLAIVSLALTREREALHADIAQRSGEIRASLARAQDDADEAILSGLAQIEDLLHERAAITAHVHWLDDTSRPVGRYSVPGLNALAGLRAQLGDAPGSATSERQAQIDHEARVDAWNDLVKRARATVPSSELVPVIDPYDASGKSYPALDAAIEREYDRMVEAGETPPAPVVKKWMQKLGTAAKPKGQGTGWAADPRPEPTHMPPDTESAEARSADLNRKAALT
jgi:hypothetical protein